MKKSRSGINPEATPSGTGCVECVEQGGWWFHLRRCAECGHVGCCDSSPGRHSTAHFHATKHPVIQSFEPGEGWFWDFTTESEFEGPELAPPDAHPADQPVPGPKGKVPQDWKSKLHA